MHVEQLERLIRNYPDFPKHGVIFRDISPILADPNAFRLAIDSMTKKVEGIAFDRIVAIDARGFIFGSALALELQKGLVLCRKASKLPGEVVTAAYGYEYNQDELSLQKGSIAAGDKVLLVDDVLATGNTLMAAYDLVTQLGGEVTGILCFVELSYLDGRKLLERHVPGMNLQTVVEIQS